MEANKLMTARDAQRLLLRARVLAIHEASAGAYGSPRIHDALKDAGVNVSRKSVEKTMRLAGIAGARIRKRKAAAIDYAPNLLLVPDEQHGFPRRCFEVRSIDRVWLSDITQFLTPEGWLYLAAIIDLCSRRVVGWAMSETADVRLTLAALDMAAFARLPERGLVFHSDRGVQYSAAEFCARVKRYGFRQSMSAKGTCLDNAPMESFFATVKRETNLKDKSREEARAALAHYIAHVYNAVRKHSALGNVSPLQFENARRKRGTR
jgi:transposase InsO family protein